MRSHVYVFCFLLFTICARAQSPFVPLNTDYYQLIDRYEIRKNSWADGFHSTVKAYNRQSVIQLIDSVQNNPQRDLSDTDYFNFDYLRNDSWEWVKTGDTVRYDPFTRHLGTSLAVGDSYRPFLKHFYRKKADFYSLQTPDFDLHVNPVIYAGLGVDNLTGQLNEIANVRQSLYTNTRGLEIRGTIGKKLGFYTYFSDNQVIYPEYIQRYGEVYGQQQNIPTPDLQPTAPGESFVKTFRTNGVDFLSARGYITFNTLKIINVQFGHDRNFFGNGFRSLFLSDNAPPYLFLKLQTHFGKNIQYTNLFTMLNNTQAPLASGDKLIPPKFAAMHHISINLSDHINVGVFEAEVFSRDRFDLSYLNPIILYRYVESSVGSGDNAFIGIDFKANFLSHFLVYSQILLDEFRIQALTAGKGDWTNKFAIQLGAKYIDAFGVPNLDLQREGNLARPYTYSHEKSANVSAGQTNYAHFSQPLAHPLGGNFMEGLGIIKFQHKRLSFNAIGGVMLYGADPSPDINWGSNILKDYNTRYRGDALGNYIGQGRQTIITYADLRASYMLRHNVFLEGRLLYRYEDSQNRSQSYGEQVGSFALRWNLPYRNWVF